MEATNSSEINDKETTFRFNIGRLHLEHPYFKIYRNKYRLPSAFSGFQTLVFGVPGDWVMLELRLVITRRNKNRVLHAHSFSSYTLRRSTLEWPVSA